MKKIIYLLTPALTFLFHSLTAQEPLTPQQALERLMQGNDRYVHDALGTSQPHTRTTRSDRR